MKFVISAGGLARRLDAPFSISGTKDDLRRLKNAIDEAGDNRFVSEAWLTAEVADPPFEGDERLASAAPWAVGPEGVPVDADFAEVPPATLSARDASIAMCAGFEADGWTLDGEFYMKGHHAFRTCMVGDMADALARGLRAQGTATADPAYLPRRAAARTTTLEREVELATREPVDKVAAVAGREEDPARAHFESWWTLQTRKGDPARRVNLPADAYLSGHVQGKFDEGFRLRDRARSMNDEPIEQRMVAMIGENVLRSMSGSLRTKFIDFGRACLNDGAGIES